MRVTVLTTSYPRHDRDIAGVFVKHAVESLRVQDVTVDVVSPATFRHFGIAYGDGIVGNLRREPWRGVLLPAFLASFVRAARRASRSADLVHAHWLPSGLVALATGKPYVVQLWGTDVELARRTPWLFKPAVRKARLVLCPSNSLADAARELGATAIRVVPSGVEIPPAVAPPEEPPHVLFVGRLSEEKGVLELIAAARGLPLVVVGDGPLRARVPGAVGFVQPGEVGAYLERAAVVACPSRREGYGVVARQAQAYGRPVVAARVGGLLDAIVDGETGLLVPPGDVPALRQALVRLLGDACLRARLGSAGRLRAEAELGLEPAARATIAAYRAALRLGPEVVVRRVGRADGPAIRSVRLRALATDPHSFGSAHEREAAHAEERWGEWAARDAEGDDAATFLALREGEPVGIVRAFRDEVERPLFHVVAMWVARDARREGVGSRLLAAVENWIVLSGGVVSQLSVNDAAAAARRLYEGAGYEPDGNSTESRHAGLRKVSLRKRLRREQPQL